MSETRSNKPFKIWVAWGSDAGNAAEVNALKPEHYKLYEFDTRAELDAFLLGVTEMDGWLMWHAREEDPDLTYDHDPEYDRVNSEMAGV